MGIVTLKLFQVIGDNLALNSTLGFSSSFVANYFCRFCKSHREVTHSQVIEDKKTIRTKTNVESDLELGNVSQTGLKFSCELNKLNYYYVTDNLAPDLMHDFLEGLFPIELCSVIVKPD